MLKLFLFEMALLKMWKIEWFSELSAWICYSVRMRRVVACTYIMLNACMRCQTVRNTSKHCHFQEFDTIARLETQSIDAYNDAHHYRPETQDGYCPTCMCCILSRKYSWQCNVTRCMTVHDYTWQYMTIYNDNTLTWHALHEFASYYVRFLNQSPVGYL